MDELGQITAMNPVTVDTDPPFVTVDMDKVQTLVTVPEISCLESQFAGEGFLFVALETESKFLVRIRGILISGVIHLEHGSIIAGMLFVAV